MRPHGYFRATCHPWPGLLFVLPLLAVYEAGLLLLVHSEPESLRNGADTWLRWALANLGFAGLLWAPVLLLAILLLWTLWRRADRPDTHLVTLWGGMTMESVLFGAVLWGISHSAWPLLTDFGLGVPSAAAGGDTLEQLIGYLGAGIYEEALFRLVLFSGLMWLLRMLEFPALSALGLAAVASALAFAAAHNAGPHGEHFDGHVFLFRTCAGLYFAMLFHWRGFGVSVGAHTAYDVLVGVVA